MVHMTLTYNSSECTVKYQFLKWCKLPTYCNSTVLHKTIVVYTVLNDQISENKQRKADSWLNKGFHISFLQQRMDIGPVMLTDINNNDNNKHGHNYE